MKKSRFLLLSLGTILTVVTPTVALISCGISGTQPKTIENKMQNITKTQVKTAIHNQLSNIGTPSMPNDWSTTINDLSGVFIHIENWAPIQGSVTMEAVIYKANAVTRHFTDITIGGFSYIPRVVASIPVPILGTNSIPDAHYGFSQRIDATHYLIGTYNKGVYQVTLDLNGIVTSSIPVKTIGANSIPDVDTGFAQRIGDSNHYLIGTKTMGVYQVTLDVKGMVTSSIQVTTTGANSIPDVALGFIQKLDETHYLIGTNNNGVYQVVVGADGLVKITVPYTQIPTVIGGFATKLDDTHYWIGTSGSGIYQVTTDVAGTAIKTSVAISTSVIPGVGYGWAQQIDSTHYLIGTYNKGVYQVTLNADGSIKTSIQVPMKGINSIPDVSTGFITKIDTRHYLITTIDGDIYGITVDKDGMVKSSILIPKNLIPSVQTGWAQQIDTTHYLIGTATKGVYQVKVSYFT